MKYNKEQIDILKSEYQELKDLIRERTRENYRDRDVEKSKYDNTCPKCGKTKVVDDIKRIQGSFDGSIGGSFLGFSGSAHGEIDTNEVSVCKSCGNVWKKLALEGSSTNEVMRSLFWALYNYWDYVKQSKNVVFDKNDITEKFNSFEEKRKDILDWAEIFKTQEKSVFGEDFTLKKYHIETVRKILEENKYSISSYMKEEIENYPDSYFVEWGCKSFPKPVSWLKRLTSKLFKRR